MSMMLAVSFSFIFNSETRRKVHKSSPIIETQWSNWISEVWEVQKNFQPSPGFKVKLFRSRLRYILRIWTVEFRIYWTFRICQQNCNSKMSICPQFSRLYPLCIICTKIQVYYAVLFFIFRGPVTIAYSLMQSIVDVIGPRTPGIPVSRTIMTTRMKSFSTGHCIIKSNQKLLQQCL